MFPPRSSVRAFWWRVFLLSLHQDLPFKIPGGGFTLIHSTKITRGEISGGKLSFYRTTKTSRREISGGGLPVVAPPRSPEERILVECFLRLHHQDLPKRESWWSASYDRTTKISRREISSGEGLFKEYTFPDLFKELEMSHPRSTKSRTLTQLPQ